MTAICNVSRLSECTLLTWASYNSMQVTCMLPNKLKTCIPGLFPSVHLIPTCCTNQTRLTLKRLLNKYHLFISKLQLDNITHKFAFKFNSAVMKVIEVAKNVVTRTIRHMIKVDTRIFWKFTALAVLKTET